MRGSIGSGRRRKIRTVRDIRYRVSDVHMTRIDGSPRVYARTCRPGDAAVADIPNAVIPIGGHSRIFPMRSFRLVVIHGYSQCGHSDWWSFADIPNVVAD
eukprot:3855858-Pyramimonas_sp.AAC.1